MKNNKMSKYVILGMLINSIVISAKQLANIPDGISGFGMGLGIGLEIFGLYSMNHDIAKIKNFKKNLIKKLVKPI